MKKILVIGSTVADIIINVERLPATAEDVHVLSQKMTLGGCAYNVSNMIDHFGAPYILFSPIGTGLYGDFIRNSLAEKGLISPIPTPDKKNGCCYCFVENSGERTFICDHGAEYLFEKEWFTNLDTSQISSIYICGLEIEDATGENIVEFLEANRNIPIFFGPGPRINIINKELMDRIFSLSPVVHLNRDEIFAFTGKSLIQDAAKALYKKTENTVIVTNGEKGAYYFDGNNFSHIPTVKVDKVVDTIGAGDAHMGAVIACLYKGYNIEESIERANIASALVVSHEGATLSDEEFKEIQL